MWVSSIMRKIPVRGDLSHLYRSVLPSLCLKMKVLIIWICPTLCDPMNCSPPGSSVHGILQARILEWVVIPFSRGSSWPRTEPGSPALQTDFYPLSHQGSPVLVFLCPIILFSFSHLSCPRTPVLPNMLAKLFPKMDSTTQTCGGFGNTYHRSATPAFCTCVAVREVSLISGNFCMLSLYSSKAQLLPLALSWKSLRENKASIVLQLTNTSCPVQGSIYFLHQF